MKVISTAMKRAAAKNQNSATAWKFCPERQITQDSGSGNNWARGFYVHGPRCREAISDVIRLEVGTKTHNALVDYAARVPLKSVTQWSQVMQNSLLCVGSKTITLNSLIIRVKICSQCQNEHD